MLLWGLPYQNGGLSYPVHVIPLTGLSTIPSEPQTCRIWDTQRLNQQFWQHMVSILEAGLALAISPVQLTGAVFIFMGSLLERQGEEGEISKVCSKHIIIIKTELKNMRMLLKTTPKCFPNT